MQDLSTGEIKELLEAFRDMLVEKQQTIKDCIIPKRENQGPVFSIGEEVLLTNEQGRVGKFKVSGITSNRIYLDSVPLK